MPYTIKPMKHERKNQPHLRHALHQQWHARKGSRNRSRTGNQPRNRSSRIRKKIEIKQRRQGNSGETVQTGKIPGELGLVDAEMGSNGTVSALLDEDVMGFGFGLWDGAGFGRVDGGEPEEAVGGWEMWTRRWGDGQGVPKSWREGVR